MNTGWRWLDGRGRRLAMALLLLLGWVQVSTPGRAQETEVEEEATPAGRSHYMGREIARTMSFHHAPWLTRPQRERQENTSKLLEQLRIQPGMTLCDMGCGNGYHTLRMAKILREVEAAARAKLEEEGAAVEFEPGKVLAVDIQPEMLELLGERAAQGELAERVVPVLGTVDDPKLPEGKVDLMVLIDVYHEFSHPERMLKHIHRSLSPKGVVVLAEFRAEDPEVPIKERHKMSKAQVNKELEANGFRRVREFDGLPWQHLMFFGRAKQEAPAEKETSQDEAGSQR